MKYQHSKQSLPAKKNKYLGFRGLIFLTALPVTVTFAQTLISLSAVKTRIWWNMWMRAHVPSRRKILEKPLVLVLGCRCKCKSISRRVHADRNWAYDNGRLI